MSLSKDGDRRPVRTPAALWRVLDGCAVIFHEETGRAFALNESATRVWEMCDGHVSVEELCVQVGREGAHEDVERLLDQLIEEGFVAMNCEPKGAIRPATVADDLAPVASMGEWTPPVAEEIHFAACDCTGDAYGAIRNVECLLVSPGQST